MLHKLTALLLLIVVTGSSFNKAIVLLDYSLNKNFIAAELCENRNMPKSCCQGKCFLKKQLQKEESAKNTSTSSKEEINIQWFCEEGSVNNYYSSSNDLLFADYLLKRYSVLLSSVFRPPGKV
jgi:hypothetical protein